MAIAERLSSEPSIVLANFSLGNDPRQVDCVVATQKGAVLLELKRWTAPVHGGENGPWQIETRPGVFVTASEQNPLSQAINQKYRLASAMQELAAAEPSMPDPLRPKAFFREFEAAVCIWPRLAPGSVVPAGNYKCRVWSFHALSEKLAALTLQHSWNLEHWRRLARHLRLQRVPLEAAIDLSVHDAYARLARYRDQAAAFIAARLGGKPQLPSPFKDQRRTAIVAASGVGKTVRLLQHAAACLCDGSVVLMGEGDNFRGDLHATLSRGIRPFTQQTLADLLILQLYLS